MDILDIACRNQEKAWKIIEETRLISIWDNIGAKVNLVGSLRSGLLMKNLDIDLHIYSDPAILKDSFLAIAKLAENPGVKKIEYGNLLDTEEECIEWHVWYQDTNNDNWKFDMIHINKGSKYDGYMERVTDRISEVLTPETKQAILQIKYDVPESISIPGIEIYQAVLTDGIRNYTDFMEWRKEHPLSGVLEWLP